MSISQRLLLADDGFEALRDAVESRSSGTSAPRFSRPAARFSPKSGTAQRVPGPLILRLHVQAHRPYRATYRGARAHARVLHRVLGFRERERTRIPETPSGPLDLVYLELGGTTVEVMC